jgi:hypothetical protein
MGSAPSVHGPCLICCASGSGTSLRPA